ncbi:hypothetical protein CNMCM6805_006802 [Aspergillus fumigatiaffinis]|uniref:AB hydrolase-1 domain-containing protein n=1 Tax=Aspergillus fumigatiaffinis TaxID=340414 RepID=A0A8H4H6S8_9EURO|nr:hypothetical protein CNMCM6805_006802 [Aspergillus fumigatiaffinis]
MICTSTMIEFCFQLLAASCMHIVAHAASRANDPFSIQSTRLPERFPYSGVDSSFRIDLDVLKALRREWVTDFNWKTEQDSMNHIHFVYEKSPAPDAIPLLLVHGWPGSVLECAPIIDQLAKEATTSTGKTASFDVIIPSLPGFAFSSPPPPSWAITDTARILNTLMVDVLGYETYAIHGTDWGSAVSYTMYDKFNATLGAAHSVFLPFYPPTPRELTAGNITLSEAEQVEEQNAMNSANTSDGYFIEQSTKVRKIHIVNPEKVASLKTPAAIIRARVEQAAAERADVQVPIIDPHPTAACLPDSTTEPLLEQFTASIWRLIDQAYHAIQNGRINEFDQIQINTFFRRPGIWNRSIQIHLRPATYRRYRHVWQRPIWQPAGSGMNELVFIKARPTTLVKK